MAKKRPDYHKDKEKNKSTATTITTTTTTTGGNKTAEARELEI